MHIFCIATQLFSCGFIMFLVDRCRSYCVTRNVVRENQSSSECITSPQNFNSDLVLLTSKDLLHANCCSAGTPLPLVSWQFCKANSTSCTSLTNTTQSVAELKLTGDDLPERNGSIHCVAKYLDVAEVVWTISVQIEKTDDGKMWTISGCIQNSDACFTLREDSPTFLN